MYISLKLRRNENMQVCLLSVKNQGVREGQGGKWEEASILAAKIP